MNFLNVDGFYAPDILSVVLDSSVGGELSCVGDVQPAFAGESKLFLVVGVCFQLRFNIAVEVAENVVVVGNVPARAVGERLVKLLERALLV